MRVLHFLPAVVVWAVLGASSEAGLVYLAQVDFRSGSGSPAGWNTVGAIDASLLLTTPTGAATPITLTMANPWGWVNNTQGRNVLLTAANGLAFPNTVMATLAADNVDPNHPQRDGLAVVRLASDQQYFYELTFASSADHWNADNTYVNLGGTWNANNRNFDGGHTVRLSTGAGPSTAANTGILSAWSGWDSDAGAYVLDLQVGNALEQNLNSVGGLNALHVSASSSRPGTLPAGGAGLKLWLHAGAGAESAAGVPAQHGEAVQVWRDQSGGTVPHHVSQGTLANRPTYVEASPVLNNQPALAFDGNDVLHGTFTDLASNPDMSLFVVWKRDGTDTAQVPFGVGSGTGGGQSIGMGWNPSTPHYNIFQWGGAEGRVNSATTDPILQTGLRNTADGNRMTQLLNGQVGTWSQTGGNASVNQAFAIGRHSHTASGGGFPVNGTIAEVIFYDRVLNTAERIITENYLSAKYDIPLHANTNRFAYDAPALGDYDFDLIGIGREADGALTTSTAAGLTISEWNGSLSAGEYLLAAHKTPLNSLATTRLPDGMAWRWDRVWAMDMTGEVDATLAFDFGEILAGLGMSSMDDLTGNSTAFDLLHTPSDGATFARLNLPGSVDGNVVSFNVPGVPFVDGYYTIGYIPEPGTLAMLAAGLAGLLAFGGRRKR